MNLSGKWKGSLVYGDRYHKKGLRLHFSMSLQEKKDTFYGEAKDLNGAGLHP